MRWEHPGNRGFLRALAGLQRTAAEIGEDDEAERCAHFLRQLDPAWPPAGAEAADRRRSAAPCCAAGPAVAWAATRPPSRWTAWRWPCGSPTPADAAGAARRGRRSGATPPPSEPLGLTVVADDEPGERPVPGDADRAPPRRSTDLVVVLSCDLLAPNPAAIAPLVDRLAAAAPARGRRGAGGRRVTTSGPTRPGVAAALAPLEAARRSRGRVAAPGRAPTCPSTSSPTSRRPMWRTPTNLAICQAPGSLPTDGRPGDRCGRAGGPAGRRRRAHRCADAGGVRRRTGSRRAADPAGRGGRAHRRGAHRRHRLRDLRDGAAQRQGGRALPIAGHRRRQRRRRHRGLDRRRAAHRSGGERGRSG